MSIARITYAAVTGSIAAWLLWSCLPGFWKVVGTMIPPLRFLLQYPAFFVVVAILLVIPAVVILWDFGAAFIKRRRAGVQHQQKR